MRKKLPIDIFVKDFGRQQHSRASPNSSQEPSRRRSMELTGARYRHTFLCDIHVDDAAFGRNQFV